MNKPNLKKMQATCDAFNVKYPPGTHVIVELDGGEMRETVTTSEAVVLSGHTPVIWLKGVSGCYVLERVKYNHNNSKETANPPSTIDMNREKIMKKLIADDIGYEFFKGCLVLRGPIPMRSVSAITKLCGKKDVVGYKFNANAEASMMLGAHEDLEVMYTSQEFREMLHKRNKDKINRLHGEDTEFYMTLPQGVRDWLEVGERGASSYTLLNMTVAKKYGFHDEDDYTDDYPADIHDFNRCKKLVDLVPEIRESFIEMAKISPQWKFAVEHYDEYANLINDTLAKGEKIEVLKDQFKQSRTAAAPNRMF